MKFKKLTETATLPTYATDGSCGLDLYADIEKIVSIYPRKTVMIPTNIAMEIPSDCFGLLAIRSGISTKNDLGLINGVGIIDADYRNGVGVPIHNYGNLPKSIEPNERIAQIIIVPYNRVTVEEADELNETERGLQGFGHSGRF